MVGRNKTALFCEVIAALCICAAAQSSDATNRTLTPDDVKVIHFEGLDYPSVAQYPASESQGIVVLEAKLDKDGKVVEASAASGRQDLISDSLANLKKWQFQPNGSENAVVVYNFRVASGVCKLPSSVFTFDGSNLATIMTCWPAPVKAVHSISSREIANALTGDKDADVFDFDDLRYPTLARAGRVHGTVVVQAKLDEKGGVTEASAIFGHPMLTPDCLANIKKWKFRPNAKRAVVVVYSFRLIDACCPHNQSQFVLEPPNFATIIDEPTTSLAQP